MIIQNEVRNHLSDQPMGESCDFQKFFVQLN